MEQLRREIKNKELNGLYLFYGEEKYLMKSWERSFIKSCFSAGVAEIDVSLFEGASVSPGDIIEAAETPPFMSDKKLVLVRKSELFTAKRKNEGEKIAEYFAERFAEGGTGISLLFTEEDVDKRGKAYKAADKHGRVTVFEPLKESQIVTWVKEKLRKNNMSVSAQNAVYLIRITGGNIEQAEREIEKLAAYKREGLIEKSDIDAICSKTTEARIFELVDAVAAKDRGGALALYGELLSMKEQPVGILALLGRQFRLMLKCRLFLEKGYGLNEITQKLGANPYSVKISAAQSKNFDIGTLKCAVLDCMSCDTRIKTGETEAKLGVEAIIFKYTG